MSNIEIVVHVIYLRLEWLSLTLLTLITLAIMIATIFLVRKELKQNNSS